MDDKELQKAASTLGIPIAKLQEKIEAADSAGHERHRILASASRRRRRYEREAEAAWLDGQVTTSRERFAAIRTMTDSELQQRRQFLTLGTQLDQALADAALLTYVAGANTDSSGSHGKPSSRGPGVIAGTLYAGGTIPLAERYRIVLGHLIANLQREIDVTVRGSLADHRKHESSGEKEARLDADWCGVRSEIVAALDPTLGSARSIEIMRRRMGKRPVDGTELPPDR